MFYKAGLYEAIHVVTAPRAGGHVIHGGVITYEDECVVDISASSISCSSGIPAKVEMIVIVAVIRLKSYMMGSHNSGLLFDEFCSVLAKPREAKYQNTTNRPMPQ